MKPPEKKEHIHSDHSITDEDGEIGYCYDCEETYKGSTLYNYGYNKAIDDFHKWIDGSPIEKVIDETDGHNIKAAKHNSRGMTYMESENLPHAIRQMLKGEEELK